jgi:hypothetical protein
MFYMATVIVCPHGLVVSAEYRQQPNVQRYQTTAMAEARNRERGLKAALHNPRVSEEAKQHDRELLASEFGENMEQVEAAHPRRRSSASKKSSSTGLAAEAPADQGSSTGVEKPQVGGRKARRASSGDAGGLQQMGEAKDRGNV